jgi:hypothetical protein
MSPFLYRPALIKGLGNWGHGSGVDPKTETWIIGTVLKKENHVPEEEGPSNQPGV